MTPASGSYSPPVRSPEGAVGLDQILIVCQANQCRSPYAEAIGNAMAQGRRLQFSSAGLLPGGHPMPQVGRGLASDYGFDFAAHCSREIDRHDFGGFDLILCMARAQARELVVAEPTTFPRVFTLKQFARWITDNPRPRRAALGSWLDAKAADRPRTSLMGDDAHDDVADPVGSPAPAWRAMIEEVSRELEVVIDGLAPSPIG